MWVLGLSGGYFHDAAACLIKDGKIVFYIEEERLTGKRHALDQGARLSIHRCLEYANISAKDIDIVALSWNPYFPKEINSLEANDREVTKILPPHQFPGLKAKIRVVDHQLAHAAAAYRTSSFKDALVFSLDGSGDGKSGAVFLAEAGKLREIERFDITNSLGWFYQRITTYTGVGKWTHSGKTMALAALGNPKFNFSFIEESPLGFNFKYSQNILQKKIYSPEEQRLFYAQQKEFFYEEFNKFCKYPNITREHINTLDGYREHEDIPSVYKDLAASAQALLERILQNLVLKYLSKNNLPVCFSGGVAMNCKAMGALIERVVGLKGLYLSPVSGDMGGALGAAAEVVYQESGTPKIQFDHAYWGCGFEDDVINSYLSKLGIQSDYVSDPSVIAADLISRGKVVGWFQGRMEVGARALGNRSILALPNSSFLRDRINRDIKNRELWRPFSPSVIDNQVTRSIWPEMSQASPFMAVAIRAKERLNDIAGTVHIDQTSRVQCVNSQFNPRYAKLIEDVSCSTGLPIVLNTSLNGNGMPIARVPADALKVFFSTPMDALVIGRNFIQKYV